MAPKSGYRFSDQAMLEKKTEQNIACNVWTVFC
jgi:hypothetical protein